MFWDRLKTEFQRILTTSAGISIKPEGGPLPRLMRTCSIQSHVSKSGLNPLVQPLPLRGIHNRFSIPFPTKIRCDHKGAAKNIATLLKLLSNSQRDLAQALEDNTTFRSEAVKHSLECSRTSWEKRNVESALQNAMQRCRTLAAHQDHLTKELKSLRLKVEGSENARLIAIASLKSRHETEKRQLEEQVAQLIELVEDKEREIAQLKSLLMFPVVIGRPSSHESQH